MTSPASDSSTTTEAATRGATSHAPNVNPRTGLATDYLNHFNEALMLLEAVNEMPQCAEDFLAWQPKSYREHFAASRFAARDRAIAAYDAADPQVRQEFDEITAAMVSILAAVSHAMREAPGRDARATLAGQAAGCIRPLLTLAGSMISGAGHSRTA